MPLSDNYKTPKQKAMAKAAKLAANGTPATLCRFIFSGTYFVLTENQYTPNIRRFEIVREY